LQRARKTADALLSAQRQHDKSVSVVQVDDLVEQDFGFFEGKLSSQWKRVSPTKSGREAHADAHRDDPGFVDVESKDLLAKRCDRYLDEHLLPMLVDSVKPVDYVVVIVSHGILLSHLWRRLLLRLPQRSVKIEPKVMTVKGQVVLEHLGGWSNTGFLELRIERRELSSVQTAARSILLADKSGAIIESSSMPQTPPPSILQSEQIGEIGSVTTPNSILQATEQEQPALAWHLDNYTTTIITINGGQHLEGLKRTRGGIGRAQYDEKQKTMDSFFKRAKNA